MCRACSRCVFDTSLVAKVKSMIILLCLLTNDGTESVFTMLKLVLNRYSTTILSLSYIVRHAP